ncbi:hypothetical protein GDO78_013732 [Eleutherodactylus coqui]|uniref:Uncharacterized protein n=1 Tax=Eleutherodactylus coqui TaxID=57060 RepID=A0A8J6E4I7_ELECQ|nr:hypothetical protein GDO78_013732 [Eleutherodactylus coqui]
MLAMGVRPSANPRSPVQLQTINPLDLLSDRHGDVLVGAVMILVPSSPFLLLASGSASSDASLSRGVVSSYITDGSPPVLAPTP